MLFVRRPYHLTDEEAHAWMRAQAAPLASGARIEMSRLRTPSAGRDWDWLIELHCDGFEEADRAARSGALRELVADLRLLGMRPSLVVADGTRPLDS